MNIIALMGRSRSGKNTIGDMIDKALPGQVAQLAFADKLKQLCMELFGLSRDDAYTDEGKARDSRFPAWRCPACKSLDCHRERLDREYKIVCKTCTAVGEEDAFKTFWTNREILQHIGTEGCRRIDDNVWVNFVIRRATGLLAPSIPGFNTDMSGEPFTPPKRLVVITDCRFRSEADAVWRAGGEVWRVRRPETDRVQQGLAKHASENEMDTIPDSMFQRVIVNDHTLEALQERASAALAGFFERRIS